jgi:hypothetical protein
MFLNALVTERLAGSRVGNGERITNLISKEKHMCPACIANTAVLVAGAGSTGGILAVCIGKFRKFFRADRPGLLQNVKEK